jgi:intergrase/recombinase
MRYKKLTQYEQHETNPFLDSLVRDAPAIKRRVEFVGSQGRGAMTNQLVNPVTGEVEVEQMFFRVRKIDEERFVKLFLSRFEQLWDMSKASIRVFGYIIQVIEQGRDRFIFRMKDCQEKTKYAARNTIITALSELVECGLIARTQYPNEYFINPMLVFNGSRITIAEQFVIERKKKAKELSADQLSLFSPEGQPTLGTSVNAEIERRNVTLAQLGQGEAE